MLGDGFRVSFTFLSRLMMFHEFPFMVKLELNLCQDISYRSLIFFLGCFYPQRNIHLFVFDAFRDLYVEELGIFISPCGKAFLAFQKKKVQCTQNDAILGRSSKAHNYSTKRPLCW